MAMVTAKRDLPLPPSLYERDFYSWALEQGEHLRARRFAEVDLENLIDEVEALARAEARELRHRYETLLLHLLKWEFQPEQRSHSWAGTIRRARLKVAEHLGENPGLKPRRQDLFQEAYGTGRQGATIETDLPPERFPADNPYTLDQAMDPDFWPGGEDMPARDRRARRR